MKDYPRFPNIFDVNLEADEKQRLMVTYVFE